MKQVYFDILKLQKQAKKLVRDSKYAQPGQYIMERQWTQVRLGTHNIAQIIQNQLEY